MPIDQFLLDNVPQLSLNFRLNTAAALLAWINLNQCESISITNLKQIGWECMHLLTKVVYLIFLIYTWSRINAIFICGKTRILWIRYGSLFFLTSVIKFSSSGFILVENHWNYCVPNADTHIFYSISLVFYHSELVWLTNLTIFSAGRNESSKNIF